MICICSVHLPVELSFNRAVSTHIDDACHGTDEIDEISRAFDLVRKMEKRKKEMVDEYEDDDSDDDRRERKQAQEVENSRERYQKSMESFGW